MGKDHDCVAEYAQASGYANNKKQKGKQGAPKPKAKIAKKPGPAKAPKGRRGP